MALSFPGAEVTYAELAARADFFARGLLALDIRPGEAVGILLPNCVDSLAALFGAAKIGALPVPISTRFKSLELDQVIRHSGMRVLFTSPPTAGAPAFPDLLLEAFPHLSGRTGAVPDQGEPCALEHAVLLGGESRAGFTSEDRFREAARRVDPEHALRRQASVRAGDTAVVMYTSGTTASPKGAMISHEAFGCLAAGLTHTRFFLTPEDRVWTMLPLFHIGGIAFALAALYAGCSFHHVGFFSPDTALDLLEAQRCTVVLPGFETVWLPVVDRPDFRERDFSSIRLVMVVGVPERLRDMASRLPNAVHVSCFGMTEASSFLSLNHQSDTLEQRTTTGGHPMPGMECRVVEPDTGRPLPPNTEGELLFRGTNCFDGYFRDPELTAASFDDQGWFHTGDVATIDPDGRVTFVARLKDMLKVGGENVSAAEVEDYLLRHPAVNVAQVVAAPDAYYVEVPAAFVELKPGASVTEEELIAFCVGNIAAYRVPRYVRFVTEWPMSGTKVKKYQLREYIADELRANGITEAPRPQAAHRPSAARLESADPA
ncbi:AMP-binding protein [Yinghuangia sp. ASG 101]|nr:AMP-binding protein [Yinghuangia sp. ASG 101]